MKKTYLSFKLLKIIVITIVAPSISFFLNSCQINNDQKNFKPIDGKLPVEWAVQDDKDGIIVRNISSKDFVIMSYLITRDESGRHINDQQKGAGVVGLLPKQSQFIGYPDDSPKSPQILSTHIYFRIKHSSIIPMSKVNKTN